MTRAATSLSMSQPAVSNALRRARKLMQDQLFLRVSDGVQPTSRMLAIWPERHRSLATIRSSIAPQHFAPRTDPTGFRLSVTDSLASEAVCGITLKLRESAPYARVAFAFHTNASSLDGIGRGTLDCSVGMFPALPRDIHVRVLRTEHYVCVMRRGHPLTQKMTLDQFAVADHVLVTPSGMDLGVVDGWPAESHTHHRGRRQSLRRRIADRGEERPSDVRAERIRRRAWSISHRRARVGGRPVALRKREAGLQTHLARSRRVGQDHACSRCRHYLVGQTRA
ncbi:LysR substrate-binding domain-containing protein [Streptomyces sp. NPDC093591]|uniref:LysR substrate-binding domain-containing protein n=1 Tax=Streptomyces sp. NPDC093591 TaxID=3366044 RepID=UPI0038113C6F